MFSCIVDRIRDKLKQKPWIVAVYRSLQRKMYAKYVNDQQRGGPGVNVKIKNNSSKIINESHLPLC